MEIVMKILTALAAGLGVILLAGASAHAQDTSYAPWQGQSQTGDMMPDLLKTLRALTDKADHDKAANPVFLADLRRVISDYDTRYRWPIGLLFDDFHDGEFANNPTWHVVAGQWQVTNRGGTNALFSSVHNDNGYNQQSILWRVTSKNWVWILTYRKRKRAFSDSALVL